MRHETYAHDVEIQSTDAETTPAAIMARRETASFGEFVRGDNRPGVIAMAKMGLGGFLERRRYRKERPPRMVRKEEAEAAEKSPELFISHKIDDLIGRTGKLRNVDTNKLPFDLTGTEFGEHLPEGYIRLLAPGSWAGPVSEEDADEFVPDRPRTWGQLRLCFAVRRKKSVVVHGEIGNMPTHPKAPKDEPHSEVTLVLIDAYSHDPKSRAKGHVVGSKVLDVNDLREHGETLKRIVRTQSAQLGHIEAESLSNRDY